MTVAFKSLLVEGYLSTPYPNIGIAMILPLKFLWNLQNFNYRPTEQSEREKYRQK